MLPLAALRDGGEGGALLWAARAEDGCPGPVTRALAARLV